MARRRRLSFLHSARSLFELRVQIDDMVANQAAFAYGLARTSAVDFSAPCADDPMSSRVCRQADCGREYLDWLGQINESPKVARKEWEHVAILRALTASGVLGPGTRGLGFAVGKEPLVGALAAQGPEIVATDLPSHDPKAANWTSTNQHSQHLDDLRNPDICADDLLDQRVSFQAVDMNHIPSDLVGFDFLWSACAFEHLGSIEAGLTFVERAMRCLAPGGIAVHTTEFNLDSDVDTVVTGDTVVYRASDFAELAHRLATHGHTMAPLVIGERAGVFDYLIDTRPNHFGTLVTRMGDYRITSAVLVVQAAGTP
jgi:hypothetical protein